MLVALLLLACRYPPTDDGRALQDAYIDAWCRVYSTSACVASQEETCDEARDMGTRDACERWQRWAMSDCVGLDEAFAAAEADVHACTELLRTFDCDDGAFCDADGAPIDETGVCAPVRELLVASCPGDYGSDTP